MAAADAGESEAMFEENPHGVGLAPGRPKRAGAGQNSQRAESPAPRGGGSRGGRRGGHARGGGRGRSGGRGRGGGRSAAASAAPTYKRKSADGGRANGGRANEDDVESDDDDDDEDDDGEDGEDGVEDAAQPAAAKRSRRASKTWGPSGLACQLGGARWGRDKFSRNSLSSSLSIGATAVDGRAAVPLGVVTCDGGGLGFKMKPLCMSTCFSAQNRF
jgi:hypothetical protein